MRTAFLVLATAAVVGLAANANAQPPGPSGQPEGQVVQILWGRA